MKSSTAVVEWALPNRMITSFNYPQLYDFKFELAKKNRGCILNLEWGKKQRGNTRPEMSSSPSPESCSWEKLKQALNAARRQAQKQREKEQELEREKERARGPPEAASASGTPRPKYKKPLVCLDREVFLKTLASEGYGHGGHGKCGHALAQIALVSYATLPWLPEDISPALSTVGLLRRYEEADPRCECVEEVIGMVDTFGMLGLSDAATKMGHTSVLERIDKYMYRYGCHVCHPREFGQCVQGLAIVLALATPCVDVARTITNVAMKLLKTPGIPEIPELSALQEVLTLIGFVETGRHPLLKRVAEDGTASSSSFSSRPHA